MKYENKMTRNRTDRRRTGGALDCLSVDEAVRLVRTLWQARLLKANAGPLPELAAGSDVTAETLVPYFKETLSSAGWHALVCAQRRHNRQHPDRAWELTSPTDFLAALKATLPYSVAPAEGVAHGAGLEYASGQRRARSVSVAGNGRREPGQKAGSFHPGMGPREWLLSPRAFWQRLRARARRTLAVTLSENALSGAALYAARMEGAEIERDLAFQKIERLRDKLCRQLQVFCHEQGIPLPVPYSREEAYCLHLLATYFTALAESESLIAKRGTVLARRQIDLESLKAELSLDSRLLPPLLDSLWQVDPLREALRWERIRHKTAVVVGSGVAAVAGGLYAVVESICEVFIVPVARYAPVAVPVLLVAVLTLAAQTLTAGAPLSFSALTQYLARAVWNAGIALGAVLVVYGSWHYLAQRRRPPDASHPETELKD